MPFPHEGHNKDPGGNEGWVEKKQEEEREEEEAAKGGRVVVEAELFGAPCDARRWGCTAASGNDGFSHVLDAALCADVAEPRLALLRLAVLRTGGGSGGGGPAAVAVVPMHLLRPGLRWVQLHDPAARSGSPPAAGFALARLLLLVRIKPLVGAAGPAGADAVSRCGGCGDGGDGSGPKGEPAGLEKKRSFLGGLRSRTGT